MKTLYWLVKREIWEHKGGFVWAPLIGGIVFLVLNVMGVVTGEVMGASHGVRFGPGNMGEMTKMLDTRHLAEVGVGLDIAMMSATALLVLIMGFVVFFYCLGALYDDRRDRSLLFWKSLPISDTKTVLSKVITAGIVAPVVTIVAGVVTGALMLLLFATVMSLHGVGVWELLMLAHPVRVMLNLLGAIPLYFLWALPTLGWLLLCSAWAKGKPFLWAVAIPVVTGVVVGWFSLLGILGNTRAFWHDVLLRILGGTFPGTWFGSIDNMVTDDKAETIGRVLDLGHMYSALATPSGYIGIVAGAVLIGGAIWLRRWRDEA
jgi:ABC-2 type transport system permease protein